MHFPVNGCAGFVAIAEALPGSNIKRLNMSQNQIGDQGAIVLGSALPGSSAEHNWCTGDTSRTTGHLQRQLCSVLLRSKAKRASVARETGRIIFTPRAFR